jgi:hypothetical protein
MAKKGMKWEGSKADEKADAAGQRKVDKKRGKKGERKAGKR